MDLLPLASSGSRTKASTPSVPRQWEKLPEHQVREILDLRSKCGWGSVRIARHLRVHQQQVQKCLRAHHQQRGHGVSRLDSGLINRVVARLHLGQDHYSSLSREYGVSLTTLNRLAEKHGAPTAQQVQIRLRKVQGRRTQIKRSKATAPAPPREFKHPYDILRDQWAAGMPLDDMATQAGINYRTLKALVGQHRKKHGWFPPRQRTRRPDRRLPITNASAE